MALSRLWSAPLKDVAYQSHIKETIRERKRKKSLWVLAVLTVTAFKMSRPTPSWVVLCEVCAMLSSVIQEFFLELGDLEGEERKILSEVFSDLKIAKNVQDWKLQF